MNVKNTGTGLIVMSAALLLMQTASAALLAYDGFDEYADGTLASNNGGSGWTSSWDSNTVTADVQSGGLSYSNGSISINGGSKAITVFGSNTNNEQAILRSFTPTTSNGNLYFSYLVQSNTSDVDDFYRMLLTATESRNEAGGGIGDVQTGAAEFGARVGKTGPDASTGDTYATGTTYFLVGKLSSQGGTAYDQLEMWINPSSSTEGAADLSVSSNTGETDMVNWGMRSVNVNNSGDKVFDEFRVGTTYNAVTIPEPGTFALMAGALVVLALTEHRRRRK
ncbi:MAG: PEP-CTERM sorting domain-containing protein [Kiritimatiellia bacterium]